MKDSIDFDKLVAHWVETSEKDYQTMLHLYKSKDYNWTLFIGHIVIEKLLKACVVEKLKQHAPPTHDLLRLAQKAEINFSEEQKDWLDTITTFNLNTRYDSYKQEFYRKCTPAYTAEWMAKIKTLRKWIKEKQLK